MENAEADKNDTTNAPTEWDEDMRAVLASGVSVVRTNALAVTIAQQDGRWFQGNVDALYQLLPAHERSSYDELVHAMAITDSVNTLGKVVFASRIGVPSKTLIEGMEQDQSAAATLRNSLRRWYASPGAGTNLVIALVRVIDALAREHTDRSRAEQARPRMIKGRDNGAAR